MVFMTQDGQSTANHFCFRGVNHSIVNLVNITKDGQSPANHFLCLGIVNPDTENDWSLIGQIYL